MPRLSFGERKLKEGQTKTSGAEEAWRSESSPQLIQYEIDQFIRNDDHFANGFIAGGLQHFHRSKREFLQLCFSQILSRCHLVAHFPIDLNHNFHLLFREEFILPLWPPLLADQALKPGKPGAQTPPDFLCKVRRKRTQKDQ